MARLVPTLILSIFLTSCTSAPPGNPGNLCQIFQEKSGWYKKARRSRNAWGVSIPIMMAIVHQESKFHARAKPARRRILGFIPGPRPASAYGYAQATDETWSAYKKATGGWGADRNEFGDAVDFVGWYNAQSHKRNGIAKNDAYHLYLAYHEGHGGFARRSFKDKQWLLLVSKKVSQRAAMYQQQLNGCEKKLRRGWFFGLFG